MREHFNPMLSEEAQLSEKSEIPQREGCILTCNNKIVYFSSFLIKLQLKKLPQMHTNICCPKDI